MPHLPLTGRWWRGYAGHMCGRVIVDYDELIPAATDTALADWVTAAPAGAASSWNLKPTQALPVAYTDHKTGKKKFETAYWSLVPVWSKELGTKFPTFNARSETVTEKASFKNSVKSRRCAVPVSGFYEWTGPKSDRVPHAIFGLKKLITFAGLMSWWHEPGAADDEGWHLTATILTRASAGVMAPLHDRMPVFLADEFMNDWIDPGFAVDQGFVDAVSAAAVPLAEDLFEYRVAPLWGDGPDLIEAAAA